MARSFPGGTAVITGAAYDALGLPDTPVQASYSIWFRLGEGASSTDDTWLFELHDDAMEHGVHALRWNPNEGALEFFDARWLQNGGTVGEWQIAWTPDHVWHHLVVTFDESSTVNVPSFWLDHIAQSVTTANVPTGIIALAQSRKWRIGNTFSGSPGWVGDLAMFAAWTGRLLDQDAVDALFEGNAGDVPTDLVLDVRLAGTDSPEPNEVAGSTDGVISGTITSAEDPAQSPIPTPRRFYMSGAETAPVLSPTPSSTWQTISGAMARQPLMLAPDLVNGDTGAAFSSTPGSTSPRSVMCVQYILPGLKAQTISGFFHGQAVYKTDSGKQEGRRVAVILRVLDSAGVTEKAVLFSDTPTATDLNGASPDFVLGTFTNRTIPSSANAPASGALTSFACVDGDVLVVEIGFTSASSGTSGNASPVFQANAMNDLPEDTTTTITDPAYGNAWLEFSNGLKLLSDATTIPQSLSSTITATHSASKRIAKGLASTLTLSSTLSKIKTKILTLTSVLTASGTYHKQVRKSHSSTLALARLLAKRIIITRSSLLPLTAALKKVVGKPLASTVTLGSASRKLVTLVRSASLPLAGSFAKVKVKVLALASTLAPSSTRRHTISVQKASTLTLTGTLRRAYAHQHQSLIMSTGVIRKQVRVAHGSLLTLAGSLTQVKVKVLALASTLMLSHTHHLRIDQLRSSAIAVSSTLRKSVHHVWASSLTLAGSLTQRKVLFTIFTSVIAPAGILRRRISHARTSTLTPASSVRWQFQPAHRSTLQLASSARHLVSQVRASIIPLQGTMRKHLTKVWTSALTLVSAGSVHLRLGVIVNPERILNVLAKLRSMVLRRVRVVDWIAPTRTIEVRFPMSKLAAFDPKRSAEKDTFTFDLRDELAAGETIDTVTVGVALASDSAVPDESPDSMKDGAAQVTGSQVAIPLQGGISGAKYVIKAQITLSSGRILEPAATLLVQDDTK